VLILNETDIVPHSLVENFQIEAFEEKPKAATEDFGFDDQDIGNPGRRDFHQ
jgi:hypothetical protein